MNKKNERQVDPVEYLIAFKHHELLDWLWCLVHTSRFTPFCVCHNDSIGAEVGCSIRDYQGEGKSRICSLLADILIQYFKNCRSALSEVWDDEGRIDDNLVLASCMGEAVREIDLSENDKLIFDHLIVAIYHLYNHGALNELKNPFSIRFRCIVAISDIVPNDPALREEIGQFIVSQIQTPKLTVACFRALCDHWSNLALQYIPMTLERILLTHNPPEDAIAMIVQRINREFAKSSDPTLLTQANGMIKEFYEQHQIPYPVP